MEPKDPRVTPLWWALRLVAVRYSIGEAIAQGRYAHAEQLLADYPGLAACARAVLP